MESSELSRCVNAILYMRVRRSSHPSPRLCKTRIWTTSLQAPSGYEQQYSLALMKVPPKITDMCISHFFPHLDRVSIYGMYAILTLLLLLLLQRTIVPRHLTQLAAALVRHPTDLIHIALVIRVVVGVPVPFGGCALVLDVDFHHGDGLIRAPSRTYVRMIST